MGYAVVDQCLDDGIAGDDLPVVLCCGITIIGCYHIRSQDFPDLGVSANQLQGQSFGIHPAGCTFLIALRGVAIGKTESCLNLISQEFVESFNVHSDMVSDGVDIYG